MKRRARRATAAELHKQRVNAVFSDRPPKRRYTRSSTNGPSPSSSHRRTSTQDNTDAAPETAPAKTRTGPKAADKPTRGRRRGRPPGRPSSASAASSNTAGQREHSGSKVAGSTGKPGRRGRPGRPPRSQAAKVPSVDYNPVWGTRHRPGELVWSRAQTGNWWPCRVVSVLQPEDSEKGERRTLKNDNLETARSDADPETHVDTMDVSGHGSRQFQPGSTESKWLNVPIKRVPYDIVRSQLEIAEFKGLYVSRRAPEPELLTGKSLAAIRDTYRRHYAEEVSARKVADPTFLPTSEPSTKGWVWNNRWTTLGLDHSDRHPKPHYYVTPENPGHVDYVKPDPQPQPIVNKPGPKPAFATSPVPVPGSGNHFFATVKDRDGFLASNMAPKLPDLPLDKTTGESDTPGQEQTGDSTSNKKNNGNVEEEISYLSSYRQNAPKESAESDGMEFMNKIPLGGATSTTQVITNNSSPVVEEPPVNTDIDKEGGINMDPAGSNESSTSSETEFPRPAEWTRGRAKSQGATELANSILPQSQGNSESQTSSNTDLEINNNQPNQNVNKEVDVEDEKSRMEFALLGNRSQSSTNSLDLIAPDLIAKSKSEGGYNQNGTPSLHECLTCKIKYGKCIHELSTLKNRHSVLKDIEKLSSHHMLQHHSHSIEDLASLAAHSESFEDLGKLNSQSQGTSTEKQSIITGDDTASNVPTETSHATTKSPTPKSKTDIKKESSRQSSPRIASLDVPKINDPLNSKTTDIKKETLEDVGKETVELDDGRKVTLEQVREEMFPLPEEIKFPIDTRAKKPCINPITGKDESITDIVYEVEFLPGHTRQFAHHTAVIPYLSYDPPLTWDSTFNSALIQSKCLASTWSVKTDEIHGITKDEFDIITSQILEESDSYKDESGDPTSYPAWKYPHDKPKKPITEISKLPVVMFNGVRYTRAPNSVSASNSEITYTDGFGSFVTGSPKEICNILKQIKAPAQKILSSKEKGDTDEDDVSNDDESNEDESDNPPRKHRKKIVERRITRARSSAAFDEIRRSNRSSSTTDLNSSVDPAHSQGTASSGGHKRRHGSNDADILKTVVGMNPAAEFKVVIPTTKLPELPSHIPRVNSPLETLNTANSAAVAKGLTPIVTMEEASRQQHLLLGWKNSITRNYSEIRLGTQRLEVGDIIAVMSRKSGFHRPGNLQYTPFKSSSYASSEGGTPKFPSTTCPISDFLVIESFNHVLGYVDGETVYKTDEIEVCGQIYWGEDCPVCDVPGEPDDDTECNCLERWCTRGEKMKVNIYSVGTRWCFEGARMPLAQFGDWEGRV